MKTKNIFNSFQCAFRGLLDGVKLERNIKIDYLLMIIVIILGLFFKIEKNEWYVCLILFGNVISFEYLNTAVEKSIDISSPQKNELARLAKDVSAGGVLFSAIISAIIGVIIFLPKIIQMITI